MLFQETPLNTAITYKNTEIIKLLLTNKKINVNLPNIFLLSFFYQNILKFRNSMMFLI